MIVYQADPVQNLGFMGDGSHWLGQTQKKLSALETGGSQTFSGFRAEGIKVSTTVSPCSRRDVLGRQRIRPDKSATHANAPEGGIDA